jgi:protein-L-isoaspartate(D-aspartate) O-methyltransferase
VEYVAEAFRAIDRLDFVPSEYRNSADADIPLPIGYGQTISQPTTVRLMLEWLDVHPGDQIMDVGSGSGWTTALLGWLTGHKGHVYAIELIPDLVEFGQENCLRAHIYNASFFEAGETYGLPSDAPYDRILVSASGDKVPEDLYRQLKIGGKLVIPVRSEIHEITKHSDEDWETRVHPGFTFVPLLQPALGGRSW